MPRGWWPVPRRRGPKSAPAPASASTLTQQADRAGTLYAGGLVVTTFVPELEIDGHQFTIKRMAGHRIQAVTVRMAQAEDAGAA